MSVFLKAIDVLNKDGWCKGQYTNPSGAHCLVGACAKAAGIGAFTWETGHEADLLHASINYNKALKNKALKTSIVNYNDYVLHNKDDAITTLRKAHEYECELAKQIEHSSVQPA